MSTSSLALGFLVAVAWAVPVKAATIFWANDPVAPGETVLVVGDGLSDVRAVRVRRLRDGPDAAGADPPIEVEPQQRGDQSLKFVLPESLGDGIYRYELLGAAGVTTGMLNLPAVYWLQGDRGTLGTPGGWVRVFGRNIARNHSARLALHRLDSGTTRILLPSGSSIWDTRFDLPEDLLPGRYDARLSNGSGNADNEVAAGTVEVIQPPNRPTAVLRANELGARGDGKADDTEALRSGLERLGRQGGGTLELPRGVFLLSGPLSLPDHVRLRGQSREFTSLVLRDTDTPPPVLIQGHSGVAVEDLTILTGNHGHLISLGFPTATDPARGEDLAVRRIRVRASMYRGHLTPAQTTARLSAALGFSTGGPDTIRLSGRNLAVEDSDVLGSGRSLYLERPQGARIAGNQLSNGRWGWYSISGGDRVILEHNQISGADLQSTGGGINTLGSDGVPVSQNVLVAHNSLSAMQGWDREALTSDGPGGCYFGPVLPGTQPMQLVLADPASVAAGGLERCLGAAVMILSGRGKGQYGQIVGIDGLTLTLDLPFPVATDPSSRATVVPLQRNYLVLDNDFADAGIATQFFGTGIGHVVAGNRSRRTGGFVQRGLFYKHFQAVWFTQYLDNEIAEGDLGRDAAIMVWGAQRAGNEGPLSLATIVRGNRLLGNAHIELKGESAKAPGVEDVIVEGNDVRDSDRGVVVDSGSINVFLRNNKFENINDAIAHSE